MIIRAEHIAHIIDELPERSHQLLDEILAFVDIADPENRAFKQSGTQERRFLLAYHLCKNTLLVTRNADNELSGLAMWYQFDAPWTWDQIDRWRADDEGGKEIVFSHLVAADKSARATIIDGMRRRVKGSESVNVTALRRGRLVSVSRKKEERFRNQKN